MDMNPQERRRQRVVGVSGNLRRPSNTRVLVEMGVEQTCSKYSLEGEVFDILDALPDLAVTADGRPTSAKLSAILKAIEEAGVLVVGSPTYKGSYTGLFKHLFDLVDPAKLAGTPVIIMATGGGERHALMVEHQLRPLFGFFNAHTMPNAVYAAERDFSERQLNSEPIIARLAAAVRDLKPWLGSDGAAT